MTYFKIGINKINGIKEFHDLDGRTIDQVVSFLNKNMNDRGWDLSDLEGKEIFVNRFTSNLVTTVMTCEVTEEDHGIFKVKVATTWDTEKSWAFDPKTKLRTEWGNEVHEDWIAEDVQKELEDKIKRLERLTK